MIDVSKVTVPEPPGFARQVDRIRLEIVGTKPLDETWLEVRLRISNGTEHVVTAARLAAWSRNVGWYGWKDGMADDAVRFEEGSEELEIAPGDSAVVVLALIRRSAARGSGRFARQVRVDFSYADEKWQSREISSNVVEVEGAPVPGATASGGRPIGPKTGCLGALFAFLR